MIANTIFSCLQIAALLYLGAAAIRINRLQTLAKNLDWVIQNPEFVKNNSEPVYWPLIVIGTVLFGIIIASGLNFHSWTAPVHELASNIFLVNY